MANTKEEWLKNNEGWIDEVYWSPRFDLGNTDNFVFVDKTAVYAPFTGRGIGSILFSTLLDDAKKEGVSDVLAETIIGPEPNFASLSFGIKQNYKVVGMRYETYKVKDFATLVYHKEI